MKDETFGDRMKGYELVSRRSLMKRTPVILRIDGKAFHTFARGMKKPFDPFLTEAMNETMKYLCENIQGCVFGYTQSDEISLLLVDFKTINTDPWFGNCADKMESISASMATLAFNKAFYNCLYQDQYPVPFITEENKVYYRKIWSALFDSRAYNVPENDVTNYFIWRQQDATKNSISSVAYAHFSTSQVHALNGAQKQEKLWQEKGINWNDFPTNLKRGSACYKVPILINEGTPNETTRMKFKIDLDMPILTQDRNYIDRLMKPEEIAEGASE